VLMENLPWSLQGSGRHATAVAETLRTMVTEELRRRLLETPGAGNEAFHDLPALGACPNVQEGGELKHGGLKGTTADGRAIMLAQSQLGEQEQACMLPAAGEQ
jgi:hypothetical protein